MEDHEKFSNDPDEQLRIENELLKLKMQAELGATFGSNSGLPPEVEQQFLQQVMAFHEQQQHAPMIRFGDYVGNPELKPSSALTQAELEEAWTGLELLLTKKHLQVIFDEDVTSLMRYDFVINELFPLEIMAPSGDANWVFDYEEFHPNDPKDMRRRTEEFMNGFFEQDIVPDAWYLAKSILSPTTDKLYPIEYFIEKVNGFHDLFKGFTNYSYDVEEVRVDEDNDEARHAMGFVEGMMHYTIETEDGQHQQVHGPFKLYFDRTHGWWEIVSFHLFGFSLD